MRIRTILQAIVFSTVALPAFAGDVPSYDDTANGPLPRWREGGTPVETYVTPPQPYALRLSPFSPRDDAPLTGIVASPPEYSPSAGVLYRYSTGAFPSLTTDMVAKLTNAPGLTDIAYVVVSSASQQSSATSNFTAAGANMSKVQFIIDPNDTIWLRDYGPHFIFHNGARAIVDSHYYPGRSNDNFIPTAIAPSPFGMKSFNIPLYYSGGNFQPGPNRTGFCTDLIFQDNPFTQQYVSELYQRFQGIDTLNIFTRLPSSVDGTGHIDMWFYLVDDHTVIISQFQPGSNASAISITDAAVPYMQNLGYTVYRTPAWNSGGTHFTYANAFRVNNRIFIPTYGTGNASYLTFDNQAMATWQAAAGPGVTIVPINCFDIIPLAGAIHCIVMQVPKYSPTTPSAKLLSPDGGEVFNVGSTQEIRWEADDDAGITGVDLYYSTDDGATYPNVIALNEPSDGSYMWTVPNIISKHARVKVLARDASSNQTVSSSSGSFTIACTTDRVYGLAGGVGNLKWVWGSSTTSWSQLNGVRRPAAVGTQLTAAECLKMNASDATGTSIDPNRYVAPTPATSSESTLIFEFTISQPVATMRQIKINWEGYAADCSQMAMYVWDYTANNWCDATTNTGELRFLDNYAGNADQLLEGRILKNFSRYCDGSNRLLTVLLHDDRSRNASYHDMFNVTVTYGTRGDMNADGVVDAADVSLFAAVLLGQDTDPAHVTAADANCDAQSDGADVQAFLDELMG